MNEPPRPACAPTGTWRAPVADDQPPATVAQFKGLRRWPIVAGVWAAAATASLFALIQANQEDEAGREEAAGQIGRVERQLNDRIDTLEQRIEGLPSSEDVANLEDRLGRVEDDARATQDVERLGNRSRRSRGPRRPARAEPGRHEHRDRDHALS